MADKLSFCCLVLSCVFVLAVDDSSKFQLPHELDETQQWRDCHIFLAPAHKMGWGVFAARDFAKGELIELSPLDIAIENSDPVIKHSILDDYVYGWERSTINSTTNEVVRELMSVLSWGPVKYYNHHKVPNVEWTIVWSAPLESSLSVGVVALHDIRAGSELFYNYGEERWFSDRRIEIVDVPSGSSMISSDELDYMKAQYCPKIYSGFDYETFYSRIKSPEVLLKEVRKLLPTSISQGDTLHVFSTIAKAPVQAGERLLVTPGLVVDNRLVHGSSLAPLVFAWDDLDETNQHTIKTLRHNGHITVRYQGQDTNWHRIDRFEHFEHLAIVSEATLVDRVGPQAVDANCRLAISASGSRDDSAGIVVEMIATKNIEAGQTIKLNLPVAGQGLLYKELQKMGAVRLNAEVGSARDESCLVTVGN